MESNLFVCTGMMVTSHPYKINLWLLTCVIRSRVKGLFCRDVRWHNQLAEIYSFIYMFSLSLYLFFLSFANQQVTSEQEEYARGFEEALDSLRSNENKQHQQQQNDFVASVVSSMARNATAHLPTVPTTTSAILSNVGMSGGSITYTNLGKFQNNNKNILHCKWRSVRDMLL